LKNNYIKIIFTKNLLILNKKTQNSSAYISDLEDKIVDLSLQLKGKSNELDVVRESNKMSIGKLIHNLKNPVGVIFSFSDMIIEDIEDYTTEKLEKHLQIIKNSAEFSLQMLTQVAKTSQLQSSDLKYNFKSINYIKLINTIIKEFNLKASKKNIKIEQDFLEASINLTLDEVEISIALREIIDNSIRYSSENSTIKIIVKENLDTIETIVIDEGIGVSEENISAIFNEFFVVNTYSEDKQKCIGLGLSIANKIINNHHGKILVTSKLNKGTSFKITLPKNTHN